MGSLGTALKREGHPSCGLHAISVHPVSSPSFSAGPIASPRFS